MLKEKSDGLWLIDMGSIPISLPKGSGLMVKISDLSLRMMGVQNPSPKKIKV
jgi:hypothetical protein